MASWAMELQLGVYEFFANHTRGNKRKQNASTILARHVEFHTCLSLHSDHSTYAPDKSKVILNAGKPKYPQLESHAGIKMVHVLASRVCICGAFWRHKPKSLSYFALDYNNSLLSSQSVSQGKTTLICINMLLAFLFITWLYVHRFIFLFNCYKKY